MKHSPCFFGKYHPKLVESTLLYVYQSLTANLHLTNKNPSVEKDMDVSKNRGFNPQNGWFIMENPIKMDDLGVPLFLETTICLYSSGGPQLGRLLVAE